MAIELTRVTPPIPLLRRYTLRVTPPHAAEVWQTQGSLSHRAAQNKLYDLGNHTVDIADAFIAADRRWREKH